MGTWGTWKVLDGAHRFDNLMMMLMTDDGFGNVSLTSPHDNPEDWMLPSSSSSSIFECPTGAADREMKADDIDCESCVEFVKSLNKSEATGNGNVVQPKTPWIKLTEKWDYKIILQGR